MKQYRPDEEVDFLIIGAGASGGIMAKELSTAGFSVVVLEQGPYLREKDFEHDEIKNTVLSGMTNHPARQPHTYRTSESETAKIPNQKFIQYGRQVGGGSVHFTANYWRLWESDFHKKSKSAASPAPRSLIGPSVMPISNPTTRRPKRNWAFRASRAPTLSKPGDRRPIPCRRCP